MSFQNYINVQFYGNKEMQKKSNIAQSEIGKKGEQKKINFLTLTKLNVIVRKNDISLRYMERKG